MHEQSSLQRVQVGKEFDMTILQGSTMELSEIFIAETWMPGTGAYNGRKDRGFLRIVS